MAHLDEEDDEDEVLWVSVKTDDTVVSSRWCGIEDDEDEVLWDLTPTKSK